SALHKAAEINHLQKIITGQDMSLDSLKDACRDEYVRLMREKGVFIPRKQRPETHKLVSEGLKQALSATELYHDKIAPQLEPLHVEKTMEADIGAGLPLKGTLDLEEKGGIITDLKVMKRKDQQWADRELQPTFYCLLKYKTDGQWPTGFKYEVIVPNGKPVHLRLLTKRVKKDVMILVHYISSFLKDLQAGVFRPADPGHWMCSPNYCGFYETCPYVGGSLPSRQI
ncbi:MAG: PD-(D/E)XK nuclease family protein, partial [Planctomycetes bacterium]|nr:PD-(D/E)XK nuclease family protein [Planctomycetota bacterium]